MGVPGESAAVAADPTSPVSPPHAPVPPTLASQALWLQAQAASPGRDRRAFTGGEKERHCSLPSSRALSSRGALNAGLFLLCPLCSDVNAPSNI